MMALMKQMLQVMCTLGCAFVPPCNGAGSRCAGTRNEGRETKQEWCASLRARDQTERERRRERAREQGTRVFTNEGAPLTGVDLIRKLGHVRASTYNRISEDPEGSPH